MQLEPDQEALLTTLVEATRRVPREERYFFTISALGTGDVIDGAGLDGPVRSPATDVDFLAAAGLVYVTSRQSGSINFVIAPGGFEFYEELKQRTGEHVAQIEEGVVEYDVCLSYASENLAYVERVAKRLDGHGVRVFWDRALEAKLWGKDLYEHLDHVYRVAARYCVMFVSAEYAEKVWPTHERKSAQARALREHSEYVLPARFDDTPIPGLRDTVGYIDLRERKPEEFAELIIEKLALLPSDERPPALRGGTPRHGGPLSPRFEQRPATHGKWRWLILIALLTLVAFALVATQVDFGHHRKRNPSVPPRVKAVPHSPAVRFAIAHWWLGHVKHEWQVKVKPRITNLSGATVDLAPGAQSAIVLAIPGRRMPSRWVSPTNPPGRRSGDMLLIPPNAAGPTPTEPGPIATTIAQYGVQGFATYWPTSPHLRPKETFYRSGNRRGDLVFSVPGEMRRLDRRSWQLGYKVTGKAPYFTSAGRGDRWNGERDPNLF